MFGQPQIFSILRDEIAARFSDAQHLGNKDAAEHFKDAMKYLDAGETRRAIFHLTDGVQVMYEGK